MYTPPAFREDSLPTLHGWIKAARLASLVTTGPSGLLATPLPLFLEAAEGEQGVLYGHVAKANPQWREASSTEALAIFMGPDAYVTPSWYEGKPVDGKVVPTWNYVAVHAYGPVEFFEDADRLLQVVTKLTDLHERPRAAPWAVSDAPTSFVASQLRGIVGLRLPITRLEGKRKMSQNRSPVDQAAVANGLASSDAAEDRAAAALISI